MNNTIETVEVPAEPLKEKKPVSWQKIAAICLATILAVGLGVAVTLELINRNNNQDTSGTSSVTEYVADSDSSEESSDSYFDTAPTYTLELKDGENLINKPGVYTVTGSTSNGYIHINTDEEKVKLILTNTTIKNTSGPAIYVESNKNVHIETVGTNTLEATPTEDLDGAIYSKADLVFKGDGTLNITSSIDGIHGTDDVKIKSGTINVTAKEDGIKGKDALIIKGGGITVSAGDDALKASNDTEEGKGILTINDGTINITKSNEGLEAVQIVITGGNISVVSSDDGINAAGDNCSSNAMSPTGNASLTSCKLAISGGEVKVNAAGDGLDANGSIYLSGGTVYVDGPSNSGNGALDYDGVFEISGGTIIATGMSGMALNASSATQGSALINLSQTYAAGSTVTIGDVSFAPTKSFNSVMVSSSALKKGESYDLKVNGETVQTVEFTDYLVGSGMGGGPAGQGGGQMGPGNQQGAQPQENRRRMQ
ncbi:carbohydrate-binding domain-containing protein [Candidatus Saccharibacteria bacterium]|nr:carbohydrate-binding domain-containing protein [Candidatus Saccharibacteria bacterium]